MDFQLDDAHAQIRRMVRDFCQEEVAPQARRWDEAGEFPALDTSTRSAPRARSHTQLPLAWRMRKAWSIDEVLASASCAASS